MGRVFRRAFLAAALVGLVVPGIATAQDPIHWTLKASGPTAAKTSSLQPNASLPLTLTATIEPGWHLYALTEPPGGPQPLTIAMAPNGGLTLVDITILTPPRSAIDPNFNIETEFHEDQASFLLMTRVARANVTVARVLVSYQTCNDRLCLPPKEEEITGTTGTAGTNPQAPSPSSLVASPPPSPVASQPPDLAASPPPSPVASPPARVVDMAEASHASTLGAYLGLAALMGALSLLTPCVFPMVPITVSYFTNVASRGGRSRGDALGQALTYGLGIVLTFTGVGVTLALAFGASGLNRFAADPWLNLGVTALFVAFALSLFGVWELALPSGVLTRLSRADEGRGRVIGTLLMGLAFTLTSFTCTAPFLGTLLVVAAQGDVMWPIAGMLAFSTIFALPFALLALAPHWLASLPRSGPWLVAVKATMGLLELAAAIKFLSNVDLVWAWGIFTRPVVIVAWIVIAAILVLYLAGTFGLGRAPRLKRPGVGRWSAVAAGVVLGVWLGSGLSGRRLGELEAFLPPADLTAGAHGTELAWVVNDYETALAEARRQNRPLLVDFTGYTCTNCRWMEANMFPRPDVARELARYVRVRLYTDGRGELFRRYQRMEQDLFGTVALPFYAVLSPAGAPVVAFGGLTRDPATYIAFLRRGLE